MIISKPDLYNELYEKIIDGVSEIVSKMTTGEDADADIQVWDPVKVGEKFKITLDVYIWPTEEKW